MYQRYSGKYSVLNKKWIADIKLILQCINSCKTSDSGSWLESKINNKQLRNQNTSLIRSLPCFPICIETYVTCVVKKKNS